MQTAIYFASTSALADPALAARLMRRLPRSRREKAAAIKAGAARQLSIGVGLLLTAALEAEGLPVSESEVGKYGKPYLPAQPDFHFSLSHSGEMAMCAVSAQPLGCDIEGPRRFDPRLARRFFHPGECAWLFAHEEAAQRDAFFRLWTLKESYMKATGLGFALPMDAFCISITEADITLKAEDARPWRLRSFREGDCFAALCALDAEEAVPIRRVDLTQMG